MSGPETGAAAAAGQYRSTGHSRHRSLTAAAAGSRLLLFVAVTSLLAGCTFATKPGARVAGSASHIGGFQEQGLLWDRVVITANGQPAFTGRLRTRDRAGDWQAKVAGQDMDIRCYTMSGFTLEVDCKLWPAGSPSSAEPAAHLRLPLL